MPGPIQSTINTALATGAIAAAAGKKSIEANETYVKDEAKKLAEQAVVDTQGNYEGVKVVTEGKKAALDAEVANQTNLENQYSNMDKRTREAHKIAQSIDVSKAQQAKLTAEYLTAANSENTAQSKMLEAKADKDKLFKQIDTPHQNSILGSYRNIKQARTMASDIEKKYVNREGE